MNLQPTAISGAVQTLAPWMQYICHACGYIYNEAEGDPDSGLAAGTRFDDIPDDWACPLCGVTKSDFERYEAPDLDALRAQASGCAPAMTNAARHRPGVVIVGAGRAGWQLAEALRGRDADLPITIVTACAGDVYDKPLLSVAMARQIVQEKLVKETGADAARRLNVRLLAHTHAVRICKDTRQLRTTRGTLRYDQLPPLPETRDELQAIAVALKADPAQDLAFRCRFLDQGDVALPEIAQPAVDQLGAAAARAARIVAGFQQRDGQSAQRRITGDARPRHSSADDDQVEALPLQRREAVRPVARVDPACVRHACPSHG